MEKTRCKWCNLDNELYVKYHDEEWGIPKFDNDYLFEMLILESFQAGLSWITILKKRDAFREAFDDFNIEKEGFRFSSASDGKEGFEKIVAERKENGN